MPDDPVANRGRLTSGLMLLALIVTIAAIAIIYRPWSQQSTAGIDGSTPGMIDSNVLPEPGRLAPDFALERADGSLLRLSDLRGRPVFLNFWADWCTYCKEEMPDMQRVADHYGDDLIVIGVNAGDPVEVGERFVRSAGVTYERLYDLDMAVTDGYQVRAMPTSFFIHADGTIVEYSFGVMSYETMLEKVATVVR